MSRCEPKQLGLPQAELISDGDKISDDHISEVSDRGYSRPSGKGLKEAD
jgi:hypothetical protein